LLEFNSKGLLVPSINLSTSLLEMKSVFVDAIDSKIRPIIFEKYMQYSITLKALLDGANYFQWINGSFVTLEKNPRDIDLVSFIDFKLVEQKEKELEIFNTLSKKDRMLDVYIVPIYPKSHPQEFFSTSDKLAWLDKFGKTRRNRNGVRLEKGFLEIFH
jgi:hypothetical protein